ncbi:TRAP transporter small permease [Marinomonas spartinae]|uniref:TRAP transporter small permease n=1 Tax=Marinomonas spartinae TaxID=1792290 RepID=UPI0018F1345D|nr:TRAP transporter small permease [Marinomonas spartinae]MBJ7556608.1 TRAP transporter small permease [Marinomonas spartinae]
MLKPIKLIEKHFEEFLCSLMLGYIMVSLNIEVFNRYVLNSPSAYTDEAARLLMIMIVFLGVPWAVKLDKHVIIDLIPVSEKWRTRRRVIALISHLIFITFSICFIFASIHAAEFHHMLGTVTEGMEIPYWIPLSILPAIFGLTIIRLLQRIYLLLTNKTLIEEHEVPHV